MGHSRLFSVSHGSLYCRGRRQLTKVPRFRGRTALRLHRRELLGGAAFLVIGISGRVEPECVALPEPHFPPAPFIKDCGFSSTPPACRVSKRWWIA